MTEHHVHFQQAAIERDSDYGNRHIGEAERKEWTAMLVAQMEAAFASAKTLPVNPLRAINFSITVKQ